MIHTLVSWTSENLINHLWKDIPLPSLPAHIYACYTCICKNCRINNTCAHVNIMWHPK